MFPLSGGMGYFGIREVRGASAEVRSRRIAVVGGRRPRPLTQVSGSHVWRGRSASAGQSRGYEVGSVREKGVLVAEPEGSRSTF